MGRIIGDGYLFLQIVDVAVLPEHQKKGLGKIIMRALVDWIDKNTTKDCYVSLFAVGKAYLLYESFGFVSNDISYYKNGDLLDMNKYNYGMDEQKIFEQHLQQQIAAGSN
ncbi:hypothetical protein G6F42_025680 [Rhizopus arrhizus]|nr:hypothetical protein G6F42_025680 [Rhizopus arrhizus]